jgi:drug/metabolite transporter (DMT)-like permease
VRVLQIPTARSGLIATFPSMYSAAGFGLAVIAALTTSLRPIFTKLAYQYMSDPVTLLALRMSLSVPFVVAMAAFGDRKGTRPFNVTWQDAALCASLGFVGYYLSGLFETTGLRYIDAALARLLLFLCPTFVLILSWAFFKRRPRWRELAALVVTYAGVTLVFLARLNQSDGTTESYWSGAFLVLLSAASWSVYLVGCDRVIARIGTIPLVAGATLAASGYSVSQFLLTRPLSAVILPAQVYEIALAMALLNTVAPVFMIGEALRRVGAADVAMISAIGPVGTAILGYLFLNEVMTGGQIVGGTLVLVGVLIIGAKGTAVRPRDQKKTAASRL